MRDLFVFTADADAQALIRSVLARPRALKIRPITYEVDRHTGRDPGMVKDGPELIRMKIQKTAFQKVILIWDHHGSGWEAKSPEKAQNDLRARLDQVTWKDRSQAVVVVPEIEEWLWHCPDSIAKHLGCSAAHLTDLVRRFAMKFNLDCNACTADKPKELFEEALYQQARRRPLQRDFEQIAKCASMTNWEASQTFRSFAGILRLWFAE